MASESRNGAAVSSPYPPRVCFDRVLPKDLFRPNVTTRPAGNGSGGPAQLAIVVNKMWVNGSTLRVSFLGGTASQQAMVKEFAKEWTDHANLTFEFGTDPDAEFRITFDPTDGAWSYIGTDCRGIPLDQATMNLGWQDQGVILHEFGHAIGLIHEHQSPSGGINWNKPAVYRDLGLPPNNWPKSVVDHNMFAKYSATQTNFTAMDPTSIMMYSFPAHWTTDGFSAPENSVLSETDRAFIGGAQAYTKAAAPADGPPRLEIGREATADIGEPGEEDLFRFDADAAGRYVVETSGGTDVFMSLYGPDSQTALIAQNDDSGPGLNARVVRNLIKGTYHVQVRHYNRTNGTGQYGVKVRRV